MTTVNADEPLLETWTAEQVFTWASGFLSGSSLEALEGLTGKELQATSYEDLHDLGVESIGHRKKILAAVARLKSDWMLHIAQYGAPIVDGGPPDKNHQHNERQRQDQQTRSPHPQEHQELPHSHPQLQQSQDPPQPQLDQNNPASDSQVWQHVRNIMYLWLLFGSMAALFYVGKVQMSLCWHCLDMWGRVSSAKSSTATQSSSADGEHSLSTSTDASVVISEHPEHRQNPSNGSSLKQRKGAGRGREGKSGAAAVPNKAVSPAAIAQKSGTDGHRENLQEPSSNNNDQPPATAGVISDLQAQLKTMSDNMERLANEHCGERASDLRLLEALNQKVELLNAQNQASQERQNHLVQQLGAFRDQQEHMARAFPQLVGSAPPQAYFQPPPLAHAYPMSPPATSLPLDVFGLKPGRDDRK